MDWLSNLFFGQGIAHSVLIITLVVATGVILSRIKISGISIGMTWILFAGIALAHFGMSIDPHTLHFVKEFGLILFVYSVGMQVGPGFFASFKKGGIRLNLLALAIVVVGVITTYTIHLVSGVNLQTMVGIMSGAVTNTPGLGAAEQTLVDVSGTTDKTIALGYAVAYPLGVIGIILSIMILKWIFRINLTNEHALVSKLSNNNHSEAMYISVEVKNPSLFGKSIYDLTRLVDKKFVISRISRNGSVDIADSKTVLNNGDILLVVTTRFDMPGIVALIGEKLEMEHSKWEKMDEQLISRRIIITNHKLNGKTIGDLKIRSTYGVNITRVSRVEVDLVANPNLQLQIGDRVLVVGKEIAVERVAEVMGNSLRHLREPNLFPIFFGIAVGVILGSIPFAFPGIPQPVKLGLAGGPLIIAILVSRFGPQYKLITYTTTSANMMLREIGISLFLATVGLGAGEGFIDTIVNQQGYMWVAYGFIITIVPLFIVGVFGRMFLKLNYFTLMGLLAGSTTDPPALAYSNGVSNNDLQSVSYATVYPLTMFLRVLAAQILILIAIG